MFLEESHSNGYTTLCHLLLSVVTQFPHLILFTVSLLSNTSSDLVSEIRFEVSSSINGGVLTCSGVNAAATESIAVTLQEENSVGELVLQ